MYFFNVRGIGIERERLEREFRTSHPVAGARTSPLHGLSEGLRSLYFARLETHRLLSSSRGVDCSRSPTHCRKPPALFLYLHPFLEKTAVCGEELVSDYFSRRSQNWTLDYQRHLYGKKTRKKNENSGKNVFVDVCLPACLFIHLFIYYLEVAL